MSNAWEVQSMSYNHMTWDEMVEKYPDMWVAIANPVMDGDHPDILEGDVVDVIHDDDIGDYETSHRNMGLKFRRTTEGEFGGIISAGFSITTF